MPYAFGLCGHGNIQFIDALYERSGLGVSKPSIGKQYVPGQGD